MTCKLFQGDVTDQYADYLRDESRKTGDADSISFPESESDVIEIMKKTQGAVTVQGARTGITGGAVPESGHILNTSRMTKILGMRMTGDADARFFLRVQPGIALADLKQALIKKDFDTEGWDDESLASLSAFKAATDYFFPPDPTEDTAALGGMIACNASGARSYKYGPTRDYVEHIRVVTATGETIALQRGQKAKGRSFVIHASDQAYEGTLPSYSMPNVKNASGYYAADNMDLIDLFIGSEGTLGVISEVEIILLPSPSHNWAITAFFPATEAAIDYVTSVRSLASQTVAALEFFDENAISLLRQQKQENPAFGFLPEINATWNTAIYAELDAAGEDELEAVAMEIAELIESSGGSESATWMATEPAEMERMKKFRHALPEAVNLTIDKYRKVEPGLTKLGTDFAVPDDCLKEIASIYVSDLSAASLEYVIFGHIGDNHVHVNILPRNLSEYDTGKSLYLKWAKQVVDMGGTVSAEHGIGKIKTAFLIAMFGDVGVAEMKGVKRVLDPCSRLNPGNLFEVIQ